MTQLVKFNMKNSLGLAIASLITSGVVSTQAVASVDDITAALTSGSVYGDFRLRYEYVDQDNAADTAKGLTLRSRLGYNTGSYEGFSATVEFEDSREVLGQDSFNLPGPAQGPGYVSKGASVISDPETTELDQGYLQYKKDALTVKLGRQVMTLDNHRFVGHVGWRQDRQTFDALTVNYKLSKDLEATYAYIGQRNRIFAELADIDSKDHLINISYNTAVGKVTAYSYLLEVDNVTDNALDTYGLRFAGSTAIDDDMKALYTAEYAYQEDETAGNTVESEYWLLEGGLEVSGITGKLGYEVLGDAEGTKSFETPLATLHKFNGWADMFLSTPDDGLTDMYISFSGKLAGGSWAIAYHDFEADEGSTDLGSELDLSYAKGFGKNYSAGIKYAAYSAGDVLVDTDKVWFWLGAKF
tara:strand:+ start:768 stop:2006 length:1239 start_codon:yes stop_codon:yes gene_type:complete